MSTALPWPEPPGAERATAGPLTAEALAAEIGADLERATRLLATATAVVGDYAPTAPEALRNEAVIRFAGYLAGADYGATRTLTLGPQTVENVVNHAAMFRNCGRRPC